MAQTQPKIEITKERNVSLDRVRNIGVIAHIDAGKTTTTERILFYTGRSYKIGDIDEGTTVTDWMAQERERGITIVSAAITTFWKDYRINLIDTPGHVDFTAEVERSLRVLDGGVVVLEAEAGVQSQTATVWHQADKYHVPRIVFINKMDMLGADFMHVVDMVRERLGAKPAVMTLPIGAEQSFKGVVLLLERKALIWGQDETGIKFEETEVPSEMKEEVESQRAKLVEEICSDDEILIEKFLAGQEPSLEELKSALRKATIANRLVPTYCGSSLRNKGVQPVLDAVIDFLPSPLDVPPIKAINPKTNLEEERPPRSDVPFAGLAFKIQADPHVGKLTYVRIYSGTLKAGATVLNVGRGEVERIGRLLLMHADKREEIAEAFAGEIVGVIGLVKTATGDTLADQNNPVLLENIKFPEPVISLAIEPKTKNDQEKMGVALNRLSEEDPTFRIKSDQETGQTIISGMGELHLEIIVDRMKREFGVEATTGAPQVAYKETILKTAQGEGKYIHQSGGRGQYGHCFLRVEPLTRGEGQKFVSEIKGGAIPLTFIPAIEKGVMEAMESVQNIPENNQPAPKNNSKSMAVFFILLGALTAIVLFTKQESNIFKNISSIKIPRPNPFLSTPTPKSDLLIIITNSDNNKTIPVVINQTLNLELRLNRKADNKIQIDNNKVLAITEVLKYDQTRDVFLATIKTVGQGNAVIAVTERPKAIQILRINIAVK